ncbi:MAG: cation diffusion facilitator family transporter [Peptoniphilaceae bacterium]|nr:cation diffusion facilitator family transporter [Peptoniphilaceae bacterium]MDY5766738.1 cation diffusion facilitator family transporter [Peptoniphilaceae bacterium]
MKSYPTQFYQKKEARLTVEERKKVGIRVSIAGGIVNIFLSASKIFAGILSGSLSVLGDGMNNMFDAISSIVGLISFLISAKPSDQEHPFGHARFEYISSSIIAILILYVGLGLGKEGIQRFFRPSPLELTRLTFLVMLFSILVKLGLYIFYTRQAKRIASEMLRAAAADSLSDILATGAILSALLLMTKIDLPLDSLFSIAVALIILKSGVDLLQDNFNSLMGKAPSSAFISELEREIRKYPEVLGVHDLMLHEYGPGRRFVTAHVELDASIPSIEAHSLIDAIEKELGNALDIQMTIHLDPVILTDQRLNQVRGNVEKYVKRADTRLSVHDIRLDRAQTPHILTFDLQIPWELKTYAQQLSESIQKNLKMHYPNYDIQIVLDFREFA